MKRLLALARVSTPVVSVLSFGSTCHTTFSFAFYMSRRHREGGQWRMMLGTVLAFLP